MGPEDEFRSQDFDDQTVDPVRLPADWACIHIEVPPDDGAGILLMLREKFGFTEIDYCEMQRADGARATYGPCDPPS